MKKLFAVFFCTLLLCACTKAPIMNLHNQPVRQDLTMEQMEQCIMEGGARVNWRMRKVKPGLIEATQMSRGHVAVVDIPYTTNTYSIVYKSSQNLKYDGSGKIHKTYNRWVRNLDKEIHQLTMAAVYKK